MIFGKFGSDSYGKAKYSAWLLTYIINLESALREPKTSALSEN
jgi:hypothetical protein